MLLYRELIQFYLNDVLFGKMIRREEGIYR